MNKRTFKFFVVAILATTIAMPQGAMAKTKKMQYLGHFYHGEVNKKKVPEGQGVMNVGGLLIKGVFSDHSATNAEVCLSNYGNCSFNGTVTFDESDNIKLKTGGKYTTQYYIANNQDSYNVADAKNHESILTIDRVVNASTFERKVLSLKRPVQLNFRSRIDFGQLNPPKEVMESIHLTKATVHTKYSVHEQEIFIMPNGPETELYRYKDTNGRIWTFTSANNYSIEFPDGTEINNGSWEMERENGIKIRNVKNDNIEIDFGNNLKLRSIYQYKAEKLIDLIERKPFCLKGNDFYDDNHDIEIISDSLTWITPKAEVEKILQEKVFPYIEKDEFAIKVKGLDAEKKYQTIGECRWGGEYISMKEKDEESTKAAEAKIKAEEAEYNRLCKKYGKKYYDAYLSGEIVVGMPEALVRGFKHKIHSQSSSSKTYYILSMLGNRVFTVFVSNGKVTSFVDHR